MDKKQLEKALIEIRRQLHQYPELSFEEFKTTKTIQNWLQKHEINIVETNLETGVFAEISGQKNGPTIAIRADIDALPIEEQTNLPFASKSKGKMHACGHDFHTAALLGAAYLLKQQERHLTGNVRLIFQPAEELGGGAEYVIRDGQLNQVETIFGIHNKPDLKVGEIGIKAGPLMAAVDHFKVTITGKGGHAGIPNEAQDPIITSTFLVQALQTIISRNVSPFEKVVLSVTRIEGGNTWNVIPESVEIEGTIRTFDEDIRHQVKERFFELTEHIVTGFKQQAEIDWQPGPPPLNNDKAVTKPAIAVAELLGYKVIEPEPSMGGEDFSYYLQHVPGAFFFFGTNGQEDWHHPKFTIDEKAIIKAAEFLAEFAQALLNKD